MSDTIETNSTEISEQDKEQGYNEALHQLQHDYILVPRNEIPEGLSKAIEASKRPDGCPIKANYVSDNLEHPKKKVEIAASLLVEKTDKKQDIKFVEQREIHDPENGVLGDCWRACLATLTGFPYECVPHFARKFKGESLLAETTVQMWLALYDMGIKTLRYPPTGRYSIAVGPSPRFGGVDHCVIYYNDQMVFDPHPDKTGIEHVRFYEILMEI